MTEDDWMDHAACRGLDQHIFFPGLGEPCDVARRICATCPVSRECLRYAMSLQPRPQGVWGGLSDQQRRHLSRARKIELMGECA